MTAANGPIIFNASAGSDTQASGLGPPTAVYGSGASITSASAVVTGIDTTNVIPGDLLWVQSSSGRQFSIIASVTSSTEVTCDDNFDVTETGRTWAIGGKRATLENSREIFPDVVQYLGTLLHLETDQTINSRIAASPANFGLGGFIESADGSLKTITQTANAAHFYGGTSDASSGGKGLFFKNIKFANSYGSSLNQPIFLWDNGSGYQTVHATQCVFGDPTNRCYNLQDGGGSYHYYSTVNAYACTIQNMLDTYAVKMVVGTGHRPMFNKCLFRGNNRAVGVAGSGGGFNGELIDCIFDSNDYGVEENRMLYVNIQGCIFYNQSVCAIQWGIQKPENVNHNLFVNNTLCFNKGLPQAYTNYFYGNTAKFGTSDNESSFGDVDLTADPFVDAANGDFNFNSVAGSGGLLRNTKHKIGE